MKEFEEFTAPRRELTRRMDVKSEFQATPIGKSIRFHSISRTNWAWRNGDHHMIAEASSRRMRELREQLRETYRRFAEVGSAYS